MSLWAWNMRIVEMTMGDELRAMLVTAAGDRDPPALRLSGQEIEDNEFVSVDRPESAGNDTDDAI